MNNFYFSGHSIVDFANEFQKRGGKVLLIDQVFKHPEWSKELRMCYDRFPNLKIVFTGSSVMRLKEENLELRDIAKSYNLRGFSFREFLNLQTGMKFRAYSLEEILSTHEQIAKGVLSKVRPLDYFQDYLHHGFYPFFLEKRNFSEKKKQYICHPKNKELKWNHSTAHTPTSLSTPMPPFAAILWTRSIGATA